MKNAVVIGAGLMGLQVCARLAEKGWKVYCFDASLPYAASANCSGWVQPFQFKFPAWKAHTFEILQEPTWFYASLFPVLQDNLYPAQIWRPCSVESQNAWMAFAGDIPWDDFQIYSKNTSPFTGKNETGLIFHSYILDTSTFIFNAKQFLTSAYAVEFISQKIEYQKINKNTLDVEGKTYPFDVICFCEGYAGIDNPFFPEAKDFLQVQYGEWMEMEWKPTVGFYQEHYGLAWKGKINIGSRYVTEKQEMNPKISDFESTLYRITEEKFGKIYRVYEGKRPGLQQGKIPRMLKNDNKLWFNGLGSRGILYSAWFSQNIQPYIFY